MAGSVNKVALIGNLGRAPEVSSFQNSGQGQLHLRNRFHPAFSFPGRDELDVSVGSIGIRPASELRMSSRVQRLHPAFAFPERDGLGDSASNTGTRPASELRISSRVQGFLLAEFPHDHLARAGLQTATAMPEMAERTRIAEVH